MSNNPYDMPTEKVITSGVLNKSITILGDRFLVLIEKPNFGENNESK